MAKIRVDIPGFADLVISLLLDKLQNLDKAYVGSETFDDLAKEMRGRGLKTSFLQYWLETDAESRVKYKRMKNALENDRNVIVEIKPEKAKEEPEDELDILTGKLGKAGKILNKIRMKESLDEEEKEFARQLVKESMDEM
jgi:hypothetical protein